MRVNVKCWFGFHHGLPLHVHFPIAQQSNFDSDLDCTFGGKKKTMDHHVRLMILVYCFVCFKSIVEGKLS